MVEEPESKPLTKERVKVCYVKDGKRHCNEIPQPVLFTQPNCSFCIPKGTIIPGDYKTIESLREGDVVIGNNGLGRVTGTMTRPYDGRMFNIWATSMLPFDVTEDHPLLVIHGHKRRERSGNKHRYIEFGVPQWKMPNDIIPKKGYDEGDFLVIPEAPRFIDVPYLDLIQFTTKMGQAVLRGRQLPTIFPITKESAWLLGLYVAEGSGGHEIVFSIGKHELSIMMRLISAISNLGYAPCVSDTEKITCKRVQMPSRILARAFKKWCGADCYTKRVPEFIMFHSSDTIVRSFLAGYLEGDGSNSDHGSAPDTTSKVLALQIQFLALRLGYSASLYHVKKEGKGIIEGRTVNLHDTYKIDIRRGDHARLRPWKGGWAAPIQEITPTPFHGDVYNIATDDGTYLVSNCVVHNCSQERGHLQARGVKYKQVQVVNRKTFNKMVKVSGQAGTPVLVVGNKVVVGYNSKAIDKALGIKH